MNLVIASKANRPLAENLGLENAQYVSPTHKRAIHGANKVIIMGIYPHLEQRYGGICPVEVMSPDPKPETETVQPNDP